LRSQNARQIDFGFDFITVVNDEASTCRLSRRPIVRRRERAIASLLQKKNTQFDARGCVKELISRACGLPDTFARACSDGLPDASMTPVMMDEMERCRVGQQLSIPQARSPDPMPTLTRGE
jgi:hypothetical protein